MSLAEIDARIMELPPNLRAEYLNDPTRIEETISAMLMEKQLAAKAYELGVAEDPYFGVQLDQAKTRFLAARARALNEQQLEVPDFTQLAEEAYLANPEKYSTPETLDLVHVLVKVKDGSAAEAEARAAEVRRLAVSGERDFASLVAEYSDEAAAGQRTDGSLQKVTKGMMVPEFEQAAFALKNPGDVSDVVKTRYGYHVILLKARQPAGKMSFETVKPKIVAELEKTYVERNKSNLVDSLRGMKIDASPELVASLRDRYTSQGPKGKRVERRVTASDARAR